MVSMNRLLWYHHWVLRVTIVIRQQLYFKLAKLMKTRQQQGRGCPLFFFTFCFLLFFLLNNVADFFSRHIDLPELAIVG